MAWPEVAGRVAGLVAVVASTAPAADVDAIGTWKREENNWTLMFKWKKRVAY